MLITNAKLITWERPNRVLEGRALLIRDDRIQEIGTVEDLLARFPLEERLDAGGQYVMPGNICAHTHFYGAFARGMAIPGAAPKDFPEILSKLWWPLDKALTLEDVRYSAVVCLVDAIRHGATTLIDHHASPNAIDGSLDLIAERGGPGWPAGGVVLRGHRPQRQRTVRRLGIQRKPAFHQPHAPRACAGDDRLARYLRLHASLTLSDATLEACRSSVPESVGFHIHPAEAEADEYDSLAKSGLRAADRLHKHGILGPHSIVAHGVHVDAREVMLVAETGTWVTHQPRSNMNNAVGRGSVEVACCARVCRCAWATMASPTPCGKNGKPLTWSRKSGTATHGACPDRTSSRWPSTITLRWLASSSREPHRGPPARRLRRPDLCRLPPAHASDARELALAHPVRFSREHGHHHHRRRQSVDDRPKAADPGRRSHHSPGAPARTGCLGSLCCQRPFGLN